MTVRAYAPGRVNLIGEHTDYNDGFSLPIALQVGTSAVLEPEDGAGLVVSSDGEAGTVAIPLDTAPGGVTGWAAYVAGCVWALREHGIAPAGGRMRLTSDVPVGAGLSSSAALECAVLTALTAAEPEMDRTVLARIAQRAENDYVGAPTGLLDQMSSLYGRVGEAMLLDFRSLAVTRVPLRLGDDVLIAVDSRTPHQHAGGEYARRRASCERAAAELGVASLRDAAPEDWERLPDDETRRRARHVLTENRRVLVGADALRRGDHAAFGALMTASHASMRDDFEITVPAIDLIAATAETLGAHGARMTGGGFGGTVIALVPADAAERIRTDLPETVAAAGHPRPGVTVVRPGRGAHLQD